MYNPDDCVIRDTAHAAPLQLVHRNVTKSALDTFAVTITEFVYSGVDGVWCDSQIIGSFIASSTAFEMFSFPYPHIGFAGAGYGVITGVNASVYALASIRSFTTSPQSGFSCSNNAAAPAT